MSSASKNNKDAHIRTLRVAEANSRDVGRRVGRVDPKVASEIGLSTGDAVEISAGKKKKTTVLSWPAYQEDHGRGLIRIDGYTRSKLEVGINDNIDIKKIETKEAQSITLAPTE